MVSIDMFLEEKKDIMLNIINSYSLTSCITQNTYNSGVIEYKK